MLNAIPIKFSKDICLNFISDERIAILDKIAEYIVNSYSPKLVFICTHNSRRSQMAQVLAQIFADDFELKNIQLYSGGTQITEFNANAINALERMGIDFTKYGNSNPVYSIAIKDIEYKFYSKKYDDIHNPNEKFCAVMTCSEADGNCPFIPGAESRIGLKYDDPKDYDGTELEQNKYDEICYKIAYEMYYIMLKTKKLCK